ncbi:MAG: DNA polymerase III subunit alpha [Bacilli bacterium]
MLKCKYIKSKLIYAETKIFRIMLLKNINRKESNLDICENMNYVPLYIKTNYSLLESMIKIDDLINFAKNNQLKTLTITDNNMYGVMEFYKKCLKNNIKPIIGLEVTVTNNKIVLYCLNYNGYKNLIKLATLMSEKNINLTNLKKYNLDLLCIVPFESLNLYEELISIYKYIYKGYANSDQRIKLNGDNLVYINPILYLLKNDSEYIKYLFAIKEKITIEQVQKQFNNFLKLDDINDLENNYKISKLCNLEIIFKKNLLPHYECPAKIDSYTYLKQLCKLGIIKIFGSTIKKVYLDRLKYELEIIHKMGFDDYFLIVWDYVKFAKKSNILVAPGRGSAAGSLVAYILNITTIDPIKYNLLFERFLNPERINMPDIDMDFDSDRREEVINYCINKYGIKKVAPIITFSTLKTRQVIKDVARTLDTNLKTVDILCNMLDRNLSLIDNFNQNIKLKNFLEMNYELKKIYRIAMKLENLKRQTSIHAAGVVMANTDLEEVIPLEYHDNIYITGYSMEYLEELGLLKMDFLGISFLTIISDIIKDINKNFHKNIEFDNIPINDFNVYDIFKDANTVGIFQFESNGMMNFLRKLKPNNFEEIVAAIALFRPGPMANIDSYIRRKDGKEKIEYIVPELEPILKSTYGIIIYQEQIMQIASTLASYSLGEADVLRKAMSKKKEDILLKEKDKFIAGCIKNNINELKANEIYQLILKFASFGFNRSHSVAYSTVAYKMAYLKLYYPAIFLKNLLTRFINSFEKTKDYIYECKKNNIKVLKPDINYSTNYYELEDDKIRFPLTNIKNIGENTVNIILEERKNGFYKDIFDFIKRIYGKSISKKTIENLIDAGVFDAFGYNRKTLFLNLDMIINYCELGEIFTNDISLKPVFNLEIEYSKKELIQKELAVFGFYLSEHPVTSYKLKSSSIDLADIDNYFDKNVTVIVYIDRIKEVLTKNNDKMLFITTSDETNMIDVVLFPKVCEMYQLNVGDILNINGHIEKRFDKFQLIANKITIIERKNN